MSNKENANFFSQKETLIDLDDFQDFEPEAQVLHADSAKDIEEEKKDLEDEGKTEEVETEINEGDLGDIFEESVEEAELENEAVAPKGEIYEALSSLIEEGVILPFDDDKDITEYSKDEVKELIKENFNAIQEELAKTTKETFFQSLSPELQQAFLYEMNGGTDRKAFFSALAAVEEIKSYDISSEKGAEEVVRQYLLATNFGTPEEVEDEINDLKDRDRLLKKAEAFKPKLDSMQAEIVNRKVAIQSQEREKQAKQMQAYAQSIGNVLSKGELGGVRLDPSTQDKLYRGILEPSHTSVTGKRTNHFGHLLEKYQWVEPNHELILEAYMLLSDPDGYKKALKEQLTKEADATVRKMLKTTQEKKKSSTSDLRGGKEGSVARRILPKPSNNIFKR